MDKKNRGPRKPSLEGTNLWRDPRTGIYVWRRVDALTGKRFRRSTGAKILVLR